MARWIRLVGFEGEASHLSSAAAFLAVVVCVLAVATVAAALCAKEYKNQHKNRRSMACTAAPPGCLGNWKVKAESRGRGLIKTFRSKSLLLSKRWQRSEKEEGVEYAGDAKEDSDFLWQKRILMGVRCKPLNFSGQIQYDQNGERLPKFPLRSPKPNNVFLPSPKVDKEAN
ncbi:uncharacterized protein LOC131078846 [Cryptomeria japonica]|uniref:uncharacterized protein LOC131078846 n=1 Tax=Cryptomeria japonica TaxID=3369 RepID=UPI0025AB98F3|nr:uncharacterized protein LOC131078846 [Cryptomeria japonica]XP_057872622.1 uncharacterized protein LOC131078846 [Cryptomeria japonica]XP_057872623.1 uncharacterized protein LOC131078846 [Cryptomeria japonica]XP_057872624.1 uncharacterized protein LOC131078846 [Cryptomeria japonica]XP_057872625.1 uncharacterized protein LOC131078846 [Cryptomeria japonica]